MKKVIQKTITYWYIPLIPGLLFIGLSIWVFATPMETFLTLAVLFSAGFIISGILEIIYAVANRKKLKNWGRFLGIVQVHYADQYGY